MEINPIQSNEPNLTESTITRQLDVEVSFTPYCIWDGEVCIYGQATIKSMSNQQILASSGQMQGGLINLSAQISVEDGNPVWILVTGGFGTTPYAFDPLGINIGGANLQVKTYLDSILQPESFSSSNYSQFALVLYITAPPDPCANVPKCVENEGNFLPKIKLVQKPLGYQGIQCDFCDEKAFFLPTFTLSDGYSIASICFSEQRQRWWFNLNNDHSFIYNYVLEICEENIACGEQILINDWTDFPPNYDCDSLLSDVRDHFIYPINNAKYVMRDIALAHEEQHKKQFEKLTIPLSKHWLNWRFEQEDIKDCDDFSTLAEAENYWNVRLKKIYREWEAELIDIYESNTHMNDGKKRQHEIWIHEQTMKNYEWLEEAVRFRYLCIFNL